MLDYDSESSDEEDEGEEEEEERVEEEGAVSEEEMNLSPTAIFAKVLLVKK